jgi:hypothetical protein
MGQRYWAILNGLNCVFSGNDLDRTPNMFMNSDYLKSLHGIIIATPTETHIPLIHDIVALRKDIPILCEKPLSTDIKKLKRFMAFAKNQNLNITMVNQYKYLRRYKKRKDVTIYDYFKTGSDGLYYDCISIIALAEGSIRLYNRCPIWTCIINGRKISLSDMDKAYYDMVLDWGKNLKGDLQYILDAHEKVERLKNEKNINRHSG